MIVAFATGERAIAADAIMATKSPPAPAAYDWSGFYIGSHLGYAAGTSDWSATQAGAPGLAGALDFFSPYDAFKGTGSYFLGLQGGYTYMFSSQLVVGVEADASFPNDIAGNETKASAPAGEASYGETVLSFGTLRGRIGFAPANWLLYATGGFAWTYDRLSRAQLAGAAGGAVVGVTETALLWRFGWAAGAGIEVPVASKWTARAEYLFTDFGNAGLTFPLAGQHYGSDLALHELRLGLNYRIGDGSAAPGTFVVEPAAPEGDRFNFHAQTTFVEQAYPAFRSPFQGPQSLPGGGQGRETWDVTLYAGVRLWQGAELWVTPEIDQGFGLAETFGVAGFPSGEAYKVGDPYPYARVPRAFIRQTIDLGGATQKAEAGLDQFAGSQSANRLVVTVGKFSVVDVFDNNKYAHDPRGDFMNWAIIDTGTLDYAADAWGYSYGAAVEWYLGNWTVRGGMFDLSIVPNSPELDPTFRQFQWIGEIERRYELWGHPGKIAVTGFFSRGRMGSFDDAIALAASVGGPADIAAVRQYRGRGGVSMNLEQEVTPELGVFVRAGAANGDIEPYEFTDVDRTAAAGLSVNGKLWGRPNDTFGFAGVVNGISAAHEAYLNDGGLGILVGDGKLPDPGLEQIIEAYYEFPVSAWKMTIDYQFIVNPAYDRDRGPISVFGGRVHYQF